MKRVCHISSCLCWSISRTPWGLTLLCWFSIERSSNYGLINWTNINLDFWGWQSDFRLNRMVIIRRNETVKCKRLLDQVFAVWTARTCWACVWTSSSEGRSARYFSSVSMRCCFSWFCSCSRWHFFFRLLM